jgi:hypothetical protein
MWKYMARRCHDYYEQLGAEGGNRVLQVRYEDLMQDPLGYADTFLKHFNATPSKAFYKRLQTAHVASIGKYKRRDAKEIEAAERVAGEELALLGYR